PGPEPAAGPGGKGSDDLDAGDDPGSAAAGEDQFPPPLVPVEAWERIEIELLLVLVVLVPHVPVALAEVVLELLLGHRIHGQPEKSSLSILLSPGPRRKHLHQKRKCARRSRSGVLSPPGSRTLDSCRIRRRAPQPLASSGWTSPRDWASPWWSSVTP